MTVWRLPLLLLLYVAVIYTAIAVIKNRHESRKLYAQLQQLEKDRDQLTAEWSRLKLEEGTLLNQVRVETRAKQELGMRVPKPSEIRMIAE
jgi:cell division protein FtsL